MYTKHFDLNKLPFENVPDPVFFFNKGDHGRIRNHISDSLEAGRGLTVVAGPIGSGKTTLSQMLVASFSHEIKLIWIAEPPEDSMGLFLFITQEFGLTPSSTERVFVIRDIKDALMKINSEIRLLNNLEIGSTKLIQILLLGQEELIDMINRPEMEPFKQRIATLENMGKMNGERIEEYISHRIKVAGGQPSIIADTGWKALSLAFGHQNTPRTINSLCDKSLTAAFEKEKEIVDVEDVYDAAEGMGLGKEIFFYKISLKEKDKGKQFPSASEHDSANEASPLVKEPAPAFSREDKKQQPESSPISRKELGISSSLPEKSSQGLKMPLLLLSLSIAALILSISFYCQKSGSSELLKCLQALINF
jgi:general secretion pathway protein A